MGRRLVSDFSLDVSMLIYWMMRSGFALPNLLGGCWDILASYHGKAVFESSTPVYEVVGRVELATLPSDRPCVALASNGLAPNGFTQNGEPRNYP